MLTNTTLFKLNVRAVGTHFHYECILVLERNIKSTVQLGFFKMSCTTLLLKKSELRHKNEKLYNNTFSFV